jgi:hypothetical protein
MNTVTWSTAPIPADALADGDRVYRRGLTRPVGAVTAVDGGRTMFMHGIYGLIAEPGDTVMVEVPDEPVDGYNLWKPLPHMFMSGCVRVHRHDPQHRHNWERIATDDRCPEHGIHDDED